MDLKRPVAGKKERKVSKSISNIKQRKDKTENERELQTSQTLAERSMIPRPKADGKYKKDWAEKQNKYQFSSKGVKSNTSQSKCQTNFKALQGKETINIKYLTKMKSFCVDVFDKKDDSLTTKDLQTTSKRIRQARKMISDPLVFDKAKFDNDRISEYESGVFQISNVPSKTYINMPSTISILTKISSLEFEDLEVERGKIDKAIRKTKSFTIIKARNVAEEANKLLSDKEFDQRQLKNPMKDDNKIPKKQKVKAEKCTKVKSSSKIITTTDYENSSENGLMYKSEDLTNAIVSFNKSHRNAERRTNPTEPIQVTSEAVTLEESERSFLNANIEVSQDETNSFSEGGEIDNQTVNISQITFEEKEIWSEKLERNKKTINCLKNKVLEMQKACNDYSLKFNELQLRLVNFSKKIHWDQLLLEKVEKSEEIEALRSNKELLEFKNRDLESQISKLNEELEVLVKFNYVLIQQKNFLNNHKKIIDSSNSLEVPDEDVTKSSLNGLENLRWTAEKIVNDKHGVIRQLNTILDVMKNQESIALRRKIICEAQIEDYKKLLNES